MNTRSKYFSELEKTILFDCIEQYKPAIENKSTSSDVNKEKRAAWQQVTLEFNSTPGIEGKRSVDQLINFYKNTKKRAKQITAVRNAQLLQAALSNSPPEQSFDNFILSMKTGKSPLVIKISDNNQSNQQTTGTAIDAHDVEVENDIFNDAIYNSTFEVHMEDSNELNPIAVENSVVRTATPMRIANEKSPSGGSFINISRAMKKEALEELETKKEQRQTFKKIKLEEEERKKELHEAKLRVMKSQENFYKALTELVKKNPEKLNINVMPHL